MGFTSSFLQVFFAIVLVIIFLIIGFAVYNHEMVNAIRASRNVQITTPIFTGVVDFNNMGSGWSYNTIDDSNPLDTTYRNLGNATNQPAGAEFSYNFWLYLDPTPPPSTGNSIKTTQFFDATKSKPTKEEGSSVYKTDYGLDTDQFILFMRGNNQSVKYKSLCSTAQKTVEKTDVMVKCPLVKLENAGDVLTVEFNTVKNPDNVLQNARNTCNEVSTDWSYKNSYKIGVKNIKATYPKQWFMVTLVIMDTYPTDPIPLRNKVRCQIYINGAIQMDTYVDGKFNPPKTEGDTILLQNLGNLYIGPSIPIKGNKTTAVVGVSKTSGVIGIDQPKSLCMSDLTYMNYVPTPEQMQTLYNNGITKTYAIGPGSALTGAQLVDQNAFMGSTSKNVKPGAVSQIYTAS